MSDIEQTTENADATLDVEGVMGLEEAFSILHTSLPKGSFRIEVSAWLHNDDGATVKDMLDITISVWCSDMKERFIGNTLSEAVHRCRDEVVRRLKLRQAHEKQAKQRAAQFDASIRDAEKLTTA